MTTRHLLYATLILSALASASKLYAQDTTDAFLWLEAVDSPKALAWVKHEDSLTVSALEKYPAFAQIDKKNLEIYNSKERIAAPAIHGRYIYNFWQDQQHERGIWRRTSVEEYLKPAPEWETVLDIDSLSKADNVKWVFHGSSFLLPKMERCLVFLSRGGSDAAVTREFDLAQKAFVPGGFEVPESKGSASWKDENTLFVMTNFGAGSMTQSGYPRIAKRWKRGTPLSEAQTIFEGDSSDVSVSAFSIWTPERSYAFVYRRITFFTSHLYGLDQGKPVKLDIPDDAGFEGIFKNQLLLQLKSDWTVGGRAYPQGALVGIDYDAFMNGGRTFDVILKPGERSSITSTANTKNALLVDLLTNVRSELYRYTLKDGRWSHTKVGAPDFGAIDIATADDQSDRYFFTYTGFLSPTSLYYVPERGAIKKVKSLPAFFDARRFEVEQFDAVSKDGVKIPYFLVHKKGMALDGSNPTLQYAYGGFEVPMLPYYSGVIGTAWLERGGVYAYANLRGGGEFGPKWHLTAIKENRQKVNDDMIAVSEDLIRRKVTSARHLGVQGGSNGGLLVGSVYVQRPELYNAVVCQVPLLDMKRYNKLLAGASWMGEYGNPDSASQWAYIKKYSPYQNVQAGKPYPKIFLTTSTRDDRVHPGHARKMAAKLGSLGIPYYYYENTEGGHSAGVTNKQKAFESALVFSYLWMQLK